MGGFSQDTKNRLAELLEEGAITQEQHDQMIAEATPEVSSAGISVKVGLGGKNLTPGLCIYGIGRNPVTLGVNQWRRLRAFIDDMETVISENASFDHVVPAKDSTKKYDDSRRATLLRGIDEKPDTYEVIEVNEEGEPTKVRVFLAS